MNQFTVNQLLHEPTSTHISLGTPNSCAHQVILVPFHFILFASKDEKTHTKKIVIKDLQKQALQMFKEKYTYVKYTYKQSTEEPGRAAGRYMNYT